LHRGVIRVRNITTNVETSKQEIEQEPKQQGKEEQLNLLNDYELCWKDFWRFWLQKLLRNIASVKYQWLLLLYIPTIYGMFSGHWVDDKWIGKIGSIEGLAFLGGGFITLAGVKMYTKLKLRGLDDKYYAGEENVDDG